MLKEFKAFIARGNVMDLAVAVIIGAAFSSIIASFTDDIIMPLIALVTGSPDYSYLFWRIGPVPADYTGDPNDYEALKAAGVAMIGYGAFITRVINFLLVAFAVFLLVRYTNRFFKGLEPEAAPPSEEVLLLREIRDSLNRPQ
ncbi:MAG: large conductance mechanosensitive channel protein MscL [Sphingomonadaceae bacterium]